MTFPFGLNPYVEDKGHCADAYIEVAEGYVPIEFADISSLYFPNTEGMAPATSPGLVLLPQVNERTMKDACEYLEAMNFFDYFQPLSTDEMAIIESDSFRRNPRTKAGKVKEQNDVVLSTAFARDSDRVIEDFIDPSAGILHLAVELKGSGIVPYSFLTADFFLSELRFLKEPGAPPCLAEPLFSVIEELSIENIQAAVDSAATRNLFANYLPLTEIEAASYQAESVDWPPRTKNAKRYRWLHNRLTW